MLSDANCFITGAENGGFDQGSTAVYGDYMLMHTVALLPSELNLPDDISGLVQKAYNKEGLPIDTPGYISAKQIHDKQNVNKERKAKSFQIDAPEMSVITGLLDAGVNADSSGQLARAAVRDAQDAVEVLVLYRRNNNRLYTIPWSYKGDTELSHETPHDELAQALASCTLILPAVLTATWSIGKTITQLENDNRQQIPCLWQQSHWLKDELFLVLDENFDTELGGYKLHYDQSLGLVKRKISEV